MHPYFQFVRSANWDLQKEEKFIREVFPLFSFAILTSVDKGGGGYFNWSLNSDHGGTLIGRVLIWGESLYLGCGFTRQDLIKN